MTPQDESAALNSASAILEQRHELTEREEREKRERAARESQRSAGAEDRRKRYQSFQSAGHTFLDLQGQITLAEAHLRNWRARNIKFGSIDTDQITAHVFWLTSVLAVMVLDHFILGDAGREIAKGYVRVWKTVFTGVDWVAVIVAVLFPVAWVVVEIAAGSRWSAEKKNGLVSPFTYFFVVLIWLTVPTIIVGFSLANSGLFSALPENTSGPATVIVGILKVFAAGLVAFVAHGFVLWNGEPIAKAFSFALFKAREISLSRRVRSLRDRVPHSERETEVGLRDFSEILNDKDEDAGPGPIGTRSREAAEAVFGPEIFGEQIRSDVPRVDAGSQIGGRFVGNDRASVDPDRNRGLGNPPPDIYDGEDEVIN
jgi:hypothetical protein